jgi:hypothetical protein
MGIDYNTIIIEATLGITPQELSDTIRIFPVEYENHTSSIEGILDELDEDYHLDEVISELSCIRAEVHDLMELSEKVTSLIGKIDDINEFNQAIYLDDDFLRIINKTRESVVDSNLISDQDNFIAMIEDWVDLLRERKEISIEEVVEIYEDIWGEFSSVEIDMIYRGSWL